MTALRTVFMGTPDISIPSLRMLARLTDLQLVVTQPDRPAGRGNHLQAPPVKRAALELALPLWQPETLRGATLPEALAHADLVVVMAYGELLRQEVLDRPAQGCINLHASLLPRWRGASPLQAALRAGDRTSGVTVMRMVRALDAGPIYAQRSIPIADRCTLPELHDAIAQCAAEAIQDALGRWPDLPAVPQDETQVTVCRKLITEDGHLRFDCGPAELERWVRAYTPAPGCWALADGERLRVLELCPRDHVADLEPGSVSLRSGELLVGCTQGACAIVRLQPAGKKEMSAADYLRGHPIPTALC